MPESVAGKIRVDILANVARFRASMREAGREGLGSFQEEVSRFNARESQAVMARQIAGEKDAWKAAMLEIREIRRNAGALDIRDNMRLLSAARMNATIDPALRRQTRLRGLLPFGMSTSTELSREAAETAAAIGDGGNKIVQAIGRSQREIALAMKMGAQMTGLSYGPIGLSSRLISAHPLAGGALVAMASVAFANMARNRMIREVAEESDRTGADPREISRKLGEIVTDRDIAQIRRWDESLRQAKGTLKDLILALPLASSLTSRLSEGLGNRIMDLAFLGVVSPERATAVQEARFRTEFQQRHAPSIRNIREAARRQEEELGKLTQEESFLESRRESIMTMRFGERATRNWAEQQRFSRLMKDLGRSPEYAENRLAQLRAAQAEADRLEDEAERRRRYQEWLREREGAAKRFRARQIEAGRGAFSPVEEYIARTAEINALRLPPVLADRLRRRAGLQALGELGVAAPEAEYREEAMNLVEAFRRGGINRGQYATAMDRLRKSTVAAMLGGETGGVSPIPALTIGSAGAHALIAQAQIQSPQLALAREANEKLNSIDRNIQSLLQRVQHGDIFDIGVFLGENN